MLKEDTENKLVTLAQKVRSAFAAMNRQEWGKVESMLAPLLVEFPNDSNLLFMRAVSFYLQNRYDQAMVTISKALIHDPEDTSSLQLLGDILTAKERYVPAEAAYLRVFNNNPKDPVPLCKLGQNYLKQKRFNDCISIFRKAISVDWRCWQAHLELAKLYNDQKLPCLSQVHERICVAFHPEMMEPKSSEIICDTFYLKLSEAQVAARKKRRFQQTIAIDVPELCYVIAEPEDEGLPNLVKVPPDHFVDFFTTTRLRFPTAVSFDPANFQEANAAINIAEHIEIIHQNRRYIGSRNFMAVRDLHPIFVRSEPLRVFLQASIITTVMQYTCRDLATAFKDLGCNVVFCIEDNEMENLGSDIIGKAMYDHNPHVVVNVNHQNNNFLNKEVFNVIWFQDPMPVILQGKPLVWRERDLLFSITRELDDNLRKTGAKEIFRQLICIDPAIFHEKTESKRKLKAVVVGSSYIHHLDGFENRRDDLNNVLSQMSDWMNRGMPFSREYLRQVADASGFSFEEVFWNLYPFLVRERSVEWLCRNHDLMDIEVYGRCWEQNEIVRPFFKGPVVHGSGLADLYNSARYALVPQGFWIQSQRLAEVTACGCIPLLFDCREMAEEPHWNDESLFYKTSDDLRACLTREPVGDPREIAREMTYLRFARRIIDLVEARANWTS